MLLSKEVIYLRNYELYHYGVKGMKWGVRRYQNKDGSYTDNSDIAYLLGMTEKEVKRLLD